MSYNLSRLIESLVEEELEEAAVTSREAIGQKLAMASGKRSGEVFVYLFDAQGALEKARHLLSRLTDLSDKDEVRYYIENSIYQNSVGYIKFSKPSHYDKCGKDVYQVNLAAAKSGYGPLLYDYALSIAYPKYIMPDRNSVSGDALGVWDFYLNNRKDVSKKFIKGTLDGSCGLPETDMADGFDMSLSDLSDVIKDLRSSISKEEKLLNKKTGHREEPVDRTELEKDKRELKTLEKQFEKLKAQAKTLPVAYAYRIKKPRGTAMLSSNLKSFSSQIRSEFKVTIDSALFMSAGSSFFDSIYG